MRSLAAAHPEWLRPRWLRHPRVWRELLAAARIEDPPALWRAQLRGQTLLAAETRACADASLAAASAAGRSGTARQGRASPPSCIADHSGPRAGAALTKTAKSGRVRF